MSRTYKTAIEVDKHGRVSSLKTKKEKYSPSKWDTFFHRYTRRLIRRSEIKEIESQLNEILLDEDLETPSLIFDNFRFSIPDDYRWIPAESEDYVRELRKKQKKEKKIRKLHKEYKVWELFYERRKAREEEKEQVVKNVRYLYDGDNKMTKLYYKDRALWSLVYVPEPYKYVSVKKKEG